MTLNEIQVGNLDAMDPRRKSGIFWFETQTQKMCPYENSVRNLDKWKEQFQPAPSKYSLFMLADILSPL